MRPLNNLSKLLTVCFSSLGLGLFCLPVQAYNILPLGDSLTLGFGAEPGYRGFLFSELESAGLEGEFVGPSGMSPLRHDGATGRTIERIANLPDPWVSFEPNGILLLAGTNNLRFFGQEKAFATLPGSAGIEFYKLLNTIRSDFAEFDPFTRQEVFVASIPYIDIESDFFEGDDTVDQATLNQAIDSYNLDLETLVRIDRLNGNISHFVDINQLFQDGELSLDDLPDGLHPDFDGYQKIANVWFDALKPRPLTVDFTVKDLTGPLAGREFNGQFSFNSRRFLGRGEEFFEGSDNLGDNFQISFDFLGTTFTVDNVEDAGGFAFGANLVDGNFDTLQFSHLSSPNVATGDGFFDVFFEFGASPLCTPDGIPRDPDDRTDPNAIASCLADFRYSFGLNTAGFPEGGGLGSVEVKPFPEPSTVLGVLLLGGSFGWLAISKKVVIPM